MENISGFGTKVTLKASKTFPAGITLTQFADDADPLDGESVQITDKAMGLNGDLILWNKASPLNLSINVIPGSADDKNLQILVNANRVAKGKTSARDVIAIVGTYPDGTALNLMNGGVTDGHWMNSIASSGRFKSKTYKFTFENKA